MGWAAERNDRGNRSRVEALLEEAPVVWVSTVRPDGRPHLVPTWFWWDGATVLFASKPDACKVSNLRANATCMLAVGDPMADFDVALVEGRAELIEMSTTDLLAGGLHAKYGGQMAAGGLCPATFAETYRQVVRVVPTRWLPWHGRSPRPAWGVPVLGDVSIPGLAPA
jgi:PPOX class probable F420-dependent enzyme